MDAVLPSGDSCALSHLPVGCGTACRFLSTPAHLERLKFLGALLAGLLRVFPCNDKVRAREETARRGVDGLIKYTSAAMNHVLFGVLFR